MAVFRIGPMSKGDGSFAAAWFDDDACLWDDDRLSSAAPLEQAWTAPSLKLHRPAQGVTPVLFNPNALAVSETLKDSLRSFRELEFLPIYIEGHGEFYVLHITASVEFPPDGKARIAPPPSGNIVQIEGFPQTFESEYSFFRIRQPVGSAARKSGASASGIFAGIAGARAIEGCAQGFLAVSEVPSV